MMRLAFVDCAFEVKFPNRLRQHSLTCFELRNNSYFKSSKLDDNFSNVSDESIEGVKLMLD
jgi:hypothetical protein